MIQVPKGNWLTQRDWNKIATQPTSIRNLGGGALTFGAQTGYDELFNNDVQAATISDSWNSDPVVFAAVMTEKIQNFEPRVIRSQDKQRGPGPWNEFKG